MDQAAQLAVELEILSTLCSGIGAADQRLDLARTLDHYIFIEPEHQVVLESIRSLLPRGQISRAALAVHLNNRGFPDVDMEKYFRAPRANIDDTLIRARELLTSDR
jgi:hypothetical protein